MWQCVRDQMITSESTQNRSFPFSYGTIANQNPASYHLRWISFISHGLTITLVTKCDLPYSMLCLNTADIQRGQESHKRKSLKERHPPCFSVMGGELSAEWEAHIWRPLPGCRIFWSRYTPDGWTTSKDKIHATKSIWGGCSEQCRCLCDFCQSNSVQFSSRTWSCSNFWAKL